MFTVNAARSDKESEERMTDSSMIPKKQKLRNLRRNLHTKLGTKRLKLHGVHLVSDPKRLPKDVYYGIFTGQYEDTEAAIIKQKVKQGDRVLEIGAGVGFVSIMCAQLAGEENVRSFEANPAMEATIRENHGLNKISPMLEMKAVTRDGTPVSFYVSDNILSSSLYDRSLDGKEIEVESVALKDVVADWKPNTIVMDVEGAEVDILGHDPLPGVDRLILEVHPHIVGAEAIDEMLERLSSIGLKQTFRHRKSVLLERSAT